MNFVASPAQDTVNLQLKWSIPKQAAMWDTFYNSTSDCKSGLRLQREQRFRAEKESATERGVTKRALRLQRESSSSADKPKKAAMWHCIPFHGILLKVSHKALLCGILFKALKRHQKESSLNEFCRLPCTGHCKFTIEMEYPKTGCYVGYFL